MIKIILLILILPFILAFDIDSTTSEIYVGSGLGEYMVSGCDGHDEIEMKELAVQYGLSYNFANEKNSKLLLGTSYYNGCNVWVDRYDPFISDCEVDELMYYKLATEFNFKYFGANVGAIFQHDLRRQTGMKYPILGFRIGSSKFINYRIGVLQGWPFRSDKGIASTGLEYNRDNLRLYYGAAVLSDDYIGMNLEVNYFFKNSFIKASTIYLDGKNWSLGFGLGYKF